MMERVKLYPFNLQADVNLILNSICRLSRNREIHYSINDSNNRASSDIIIVNGDDQSTLMDWEFYSSHHPMVPSIIVGDQPRTGSENSHILRRSGLGAKLLQKLDSISKSIVEPSSIVDNDFQLKNSSTRALVIDDSSTVRLQMKQFLESKNIEVDVAPTAELGLEKLRLNQYDVIFLDIVLPEMDGYTACRKIKRQESAINVPVIMLTSKSSTFNRARGVIAGCDAYLSKPVKPSKLLSVIQQKLN